MDELQQDLRHAARVLRDEPALSASAILTVALAVGVTTAVFSVLYGVLLRPLPYPGADRLVTVSEEHPGGRPLVAEQLNALLATVGAGLLAGILPALRASRAKPGEALRAGGGRTAAGGGERLRALLLGLEAAIGVVLLIGAALLGHSFAALASVDAGYEPQNLLAARIHMTATPGRADAGGEFVRTLMERLQSAPGVVAAGAGNMAPLGDSSYLVGFQLAPSTAMARALYHIVTPGYGDALGLTVLSGRFLQPADASAGVQAMVVNEAFVRAHLNDGRPAVGRQFKGLLSDDETVTEIVGVVGDVLLEGLRRSRFANRPGSFQGVRVQARMRFLVYRRLAMDGRSLAWSGRVASPRPLSRVTCDSSKTAPQPCRSTSAMSTRTAIGEPRG